MQLAITIRPRIAIFCDLGHYQDNFGLVELKIRQHFGF